MAKNVAEKIENKFEEEILDDNDVYQKPKAVYHDEIIAVVSIAASILLVMSNFNMSGRVGAFVNSVLFGIFGIPAYISPIIHPNIHLFLYSLHMFFKKFIYLFL